MLSALKKRNQGIIQDQISNLIKKTKKNPRKMQKNENQLSTAKE